MESTTEEIELELDGETIPALKILLPHPEASIGMNAFLNYLIDLGLPPHEVVANLVWLTVLSAAIIKDSEEGIKILEQTLIYRNGLYQHLREQVLKDISNANQFDIKPMDR